MARKSSKHKHLKGADGTRHCNRPSAHKRKGTVTRGRGRKARKDKMAQLDDLINRKMNGRRKRRKLSDRELLKRKLDRAEKQALEGKTQADRDFLKNFEAYERALAKRYPQNGGMTPISNKEYVI